MKVTLYEFCLLHHQEELLEQWDPANLPATPQNVTYGTRDEYWWQCEKGHRWQAPVKSRTSGRGCPYCTTRRLQPGVNDFATRFPDIAAQWHPTKNGAFQPDQVAPGSHRKAWWRCKAGHEWQASVTSRTSGGSGCPVCAGRLVLPGVNDFASAFPTLAAQWHPTKNNALRPEQVRPTATGPSGGSASRGIRGGPRWAGGSSLPPAAPTARAARSCRGSTTWRP